MAHGRNLVLTAAGDALLGPARQALRAAVAARDSLDDVRGLSHGHLDLLVRAALLQRPITSAIAAFRRIHPQISLHIKEIRAEDALGGLIREGRHELALTYVPIPDTDLEVHELGVHRLCVIFPPGTGVDLPDPVPAAELGGVPIVAVPEEESRVRLHVETKLGHRRGSLSPAAAAFVELALARAVSSPG
ncbi:LysR family transcriptional regulator [Saccharopolyspora elongata]|uniref:LysR substrate-binding domain-containing protein n=1 Tax=Saccharopolyspora elongata TaxID=2530387 RepID=A0A4R4Z3X0_9PSEU|nr:LysR family transcriptional regulator substrate-binding protein [Saccharopolyspora elongata]TDD52801.1 hypothetical protein E1288_11400 [Saccharopolyspora elongata]